MNVNVMGFLDDDKRGSRVQQVGSYSLPAYNVVGTGAHACKDVIIRRARAQNIR